jgi:hypothetical protein
MRDGNSAAEIVYLRVNHVQILNKNKEYATVGTFG